MNTYFVMIKLKNEPGAAVVKAYVTAPDPYSAFQMAKAQYGALLISQAAVPA
jgi:hypothetical protein